MFNAEIKVIPTTYEGVEFRSRLEARWAVFFDEINFKWIYESEGFHLPDFGYYLPDFYLPDIDVYFEVKPFDINDFELNPKDEGFFERGNNGIELMAKPATLSTVLDKEVYVGGNFPDPNKNYYYFYPLVLKITPEHIVTSNFHVKDCCNASIGNRIITKDDCNNDTWLGLKQESKCICGSGSFRESMPFQAINKARSAKFEHGKKG